MDLDRAAAEDWIRAHVEPTGAIEVEHERPWSVVLRVPLAGRAAWFKACAPVQAFEPRLSAELCSRWPDRVAEVLAWDERRSWLLLADAGTPIGAYGNPPGAWLAVLPRYAELQRGEAAHVADHLAHGVPDLGLGTLPARFDDLLRRKLPLYEDEVHCLRVLAERLPSLCDELAAHGIPESLQHDDLHMANVYDDDRTLRVLDWGDASIAHPFASLLETFRFLEHVTKLPPGDPWFARLRNAYLEPWGDGLVETFDLALRVGAAAIAVAWARQRDHLPESWHARFDVGFVFVLRRAVEAADGGLTDPKAASRR